MASNLDIIHFTDEIIAGPDGTIVQDDPISKKDYINHLFITVVIMLIVQIILTLTLTIFLSSMCSGKPPI